MTAGTTAGWGRADRLFLLALAGYFLAQVVLRVMLGGTFEPDEAEMVLIGQGLHLAEGSQTPLYEWTQELTFAIFGVGTLGLVAVKNLWLFVAYAAIFACFRKNAPPLTAAAATLVMGMIPNLGWEAQRSNSHTIAMVAMTTVTVWAVLRLIEGRRLEEGRRLGDYLMLGLAVGLGGLSKPNYWVVPLALGLAMLTLPRARAALADRRILATLALAVAICALPYGRMLMQPEQTFADTWEFAKGELMVPAMPFLNGWARLVTESLLALGPPALVLGILWALTRVRPLANDTVRLMLRAGAIGLGLAALVILIGNVAFVRSRWLLPVYLMLVPAAALALLSPASARARRSLIGFAALLGLAYLAGIADLRLRGAGSDSLQIDRLAPVIEAEFGTPVPVLVGPHYFLGNLALARPGWTYLPPYATRRLDPPPPAVLLVDVADKPEAITRALAEHGWTGPWHVTKRLEAQLPYRFEPPEKTGKARLIAVAPGP